MRQDLWLRQSAVQISKEFQQIARDLSSYLVAGVLPLIFLPPAAAPSCGVAAGVA